MFDETFGYHADGVSPDTAVLPDSWISRLVPYQSENTGGVLALCLSPVDLAVSKLVAGRNKDLDYVRALLRHKIVTQDAIERLVPELSPEHRALVQTRLGSLGRIGG